MNDFINLLEHSDLTHSVWPGNPDPLILVFIMVLAFAVGMFIGFVYMWTHDALSYSRTFVSALAIMPLVVAMFSAENERMMRTLKTYADANPTRAAELS